MAADQDPNGPVSKLETLRALLETAWRLAEEMASGADPLYERWRRTYRRMPADDRETVVGVVEREVEMRNIARRSRDSVSGFEVSRPNPNARLYVRAFGETPTHFPRAACEGAEAPDGSTCLRLRAAMLGRGDCLVGKRGGVHREGNRAPPKIQQRQVSVPIATHAGLLYEEEEEHAHGHHDDDLNHQVKHEVRQKVLRGLQPHHRPAKQRNDGEMQ